MKTINVTALRQNLFSSLQEVIAYNQTLTVSTKSGNAVVMSEEDYNAMMETIYLMACNPTYLEIKEGEKEDPSKLKPYDPNEEW